MRHITERAEELIACGVRRLVAIFVKTGEVREWSAPDREWVVLDPDDVLHDPTLIRPVPVRALLDAGEADDAMVRALEAKGNRRLTEIRIETACTLLDIPLGRERRQQLAALDRDELGALRTHLESERRWPDHPAVSAGHRSAHAPPRPRRA